MWPPLLVGTLAGTALLITLPIGAAVWWLTLIIARSAARLEVRSYMPLSWLTVPVATLFGADVDGRRRGKSTIERCEPARMRPPVHATATTS